MNNLRDLQTICPPPTVPVAQPHDWEQVEHEVGFQFPKDYKELVERYGQGSYAQFIDVFQPGSSFPAVDIKVAPGEILETLHSVDMHGFHVPGGLDSLFPVGVTDNGNYIFWRMNPRDNPGGWGIAVNEPRGDRWDFFEGNLTSFLVAVLSGAHRVPMFPGDLLAEPVAFDVY
ncbi:SMI1/KNR4 family protein [Streptomyces sp. NPDC049097]|uniref:SMI1/KNR4 family protein n=1 Tax=Streptomyces sp. NPDC049097 TaxID=3155497 RepID=UPI0034281B16